MILATTVCFKDSMTASLVWLKLEAKYSSPGIAFIYVDFKKLLGLQISGNLALALALETFQELVDCLARNGVEIPKFLQAIMLIIKAPDYCNFATAIVQKDVSIGSLKVTNIKSLIKNA